MFYRRWVFLVPLLIAGCATTYPSARLARNGCSSTPEALGAVTYTRADEPRNTIEIDCAGCEEVYVAAQYQWLRDKYPGYQLIEHSTVTDFVGIDEGMWEDNHDGLYSCFSVTTAEDEGRNICFVNSRWCNEEDG